MEGAPDRKGDPPRVHSSESTVIEVSKTPLFGRIGTRKVLMVAARVAKGWPDCGWGVVEPRRSRGIEQEQGSESSGMGIRRGEWLVRKVSWEGGAALVAAEQGAGAA